MTAKLSAEELADILTNEAAPAMVERESLNDATRECLQLAILDAATELSHLSAQVREAEALKAWQPIEMAPRDADAHFWIVPKAPDETYLDTSGRPITADFEPYRHFGRYGQWPSLAKAILWYPAPPPPARLEKERTA